MPRARRNKLVSLTKVKKDVHALKSSIVEKVHSYADTFRSVCVVSYENMTTNPFKELKEQLKDCRFCLGKNKVMAVALGRTEEESYKPNIWMLSEQLKGQCCLFFSNEPVKEIRALFNQFEAEEFAQAGSISDRTLVLEKGFDSLKKFPHSMEPHLRSLGLNIRLMNSQI
jgi:mRNA turnover protein 4